METTLEQRIRKIAAIYNEGNVDGLTRLVMGSRRIRRAKKFGYPVSDDDIHDEVYYYEEEYNGDMFEAACYEHDSEFQLRTNGHA